MSRRSRLFRGVGMAIFRVSRACAEYQHACPQLRLLASYSSRFKRDVGAHNWNCIGLYGDYRV